MEDGVRRRLHWVQLLHQVHDAGLVCRRCGISRPTLRKWARRYEAEGEAGLRSHSRRPHVSPRKRIDDVLSGLILGLRKSRKLGARRIQNELARHEQVRVPLATIHKVLTTAAVKPLVRWRRKSHGKRYARPIPGDRVQMDTCKIAPGIYQYTAGDDAHAIGC